MNTMVPMNFPLERPESQKIPSEMIPTIKDAKVKAGRSGITSIADAFARAKIRGEAALIPFICGGYHNADMTISILLAMQRAGAISNSHRVAMENGTEGVRDCLKILKNARSKGLVVPVILMGYHSSFEEEYSSDLNQMCREASASGADGCPEARIRQVVNPGHDVCQFSVG